ncbi:MAG: phosphatidate cytidylyltransferase [Bacteroidales bacterium]|nr:phosphatidate cytidylyltransferase [Bacteroidales bacterium]
MPGHGGFLDRFDSFLFVMSVASVSVLGVIFVKACRVATEYM